MLAAAFRRKIADISLNKHFRYLMTDLTIVGSRNSVMILLSNRKYKLRRIFVIFIELYIVLRLY